MLLSRILIGMLSDQPAAQVLLTRAEEIAGIAPVLVECRKNQVTTGNCSNAVGERAAVVQGPGRDRTYAYARVDSCA